MILLIDNYDSFVFNLARYCQELDVNTIVKRCDAINLKEIHDLAPSHIIISPGPCGPLQAGISMSCVKAFAPHIPILGVCLGHQAIAAAFGAEVIQANYPMHGKPDTIEHNGQDIFCGLPNPMQVGRYHSLVVDTLLPDCLEATAFNSENVIMGIRHKTYSTFGVQFHPESILTPDGKVLLKNFLEA